MKRTITIFLFFSISHLSFSQSVLITPGAQTLNGDSTEKDQLNVNGRGLIVQEKSELHTVSPSGHIQIMNCASVIEDNLLSGILKDPSGDANYTAGVMYDCSYKLSTTESYFLAYQLIFEQLDTDASGDSVLIDDFLTLESFGKFSGSSIPKKIIVNSKNIRIRFVTDNDANVGGGFRLSWQAILSESMNEDLSSFYGGRSLLFDVRKGRFMQGRHTVEHYRKLGLYASAFGYHTESVGLASFSTGLNSKANGSFSVALGNYALASGNYSVSLGNSNNANGTSSFAVGLSNIAQGNNSVAMGSQNIGGGLNSGAIGFFNTADGEGSIAMGYNNQASNFASVGIGYQTKSLGQFATALGAETEANANYSLAMGRLSKATATNAVAIGLNATAQGVSSLAMGENSAATAANSTALGLSTIASGNQSMSSGYSTVASGASSSAFGNLSKATALVSTAFGYKNQANGDFSFIAGQESFANGIAAISLGSENNATGDFSVTLGRGNTSDTTYTSSLGFDNLTSGYAATSFGYSNIVQGKGAIAGGYKSNALGNYSVALGINATASGHSSVALGDSSKALGSNSISLGNQSYSSGNYSNAIGYLSKATANYSNAFGTRVTTNNKEGSFVIGDYVTNSSADFLFADEPNRFLARFENGYTLYTDSDISSFTKYGVYLTNKSNSWSSISDSTKKERFIASVGEEVLKSVLEMRVGTWNYIGDTERINNRHWGVMAQDFYHHFGKDKFGTVGSDTLIASADFDGVVFAAIKALEERTKVLQVENAALRELVKTNTKELNKYDVLSQELIELKKMLQVPIVKTGSL
jgi:hypothetical protein